MLNKEVYISRRRKLKENFKDGLILIIGNDFSPLDCEDNTYPFIQDATFKYYFGIDHNGLIGIIDIDKNEEIIFGNDYTMSDIIWMGKQKFLKELAIEVGIEKFIEKEELKLLDVACKKTALTFIFLRIYKEKIENSYHLFKRRKYVKIYKSCAFGRGVNSRIKR